jgi:hypothetical protein
MALRKSWKEFSVLICRAFASSAPSGAAGARLLTPSQSLLGCAQSKACHSRAAPPAGPSAALTRACHPRPVVVEFDVSPEQALERFELHQQQLCMRMHAGDVLKDAGLEVTAAYLPFWMFDVCVSVECKGTLGFRPKA